MILLQSDWTTTLGLPTVDTVVDTIRVVDQALYVEVLEKTNQQLSLWFNPYALMVGVLSLLFTVVAIAGAVIIYRQTQDHQRQIDKFLKEQKDAHTQRIESFLADQRLVMNQLIENVNRQSELAMTQSELAITELRLQLQTATETQKESIESAIARLERQRETPQMSGRSGSTTMGAMLRDSALRMSSAPADYTRHECYRCHFQWNQADGSDTATLSCPRCGAAQSFNASLKF